MSKPKLLKHISPVSRVHLGTFILIFAAIGGIAIWRSLAAPNPNLPGDLNNDNTVNITDLSILLSNYGLSTTTALSTADINNDGAVNVLDLSILLSHYGQSYSGGGGSTSGNGIGLIELGDKLPYASNPGRYGMVIVSQDDSSAACALASPTRSLVYFNAESVNQNYAWPGFGVDWPTANSNGWLLKDSSGNLLLNNGYPTNNIGDVGSSGYQQAWANNVATYLSQHSCKGVFIDDTLRDIKPLAGVYPAKYPSQAAWQSAMAGFINYVGNNLKSKGIYVAANAVGYTSGDGSSNDGTLDVQWWQQLGPSVSGLMNEDYQETAEGTFTLRLSGTSSWMQNWDGWQRLITTAQGMGRDFIGLTYAGTTTNTTRVMRYGKGSFLLEWNGGTSVFIYSPGTGPGSTTDPWDTNWTADMGSPSAAKTLVQTGVWKRQYSKGIVIVNTTASSVTVSGHTIASGDAYIGP